MGGSRTRGFAHAHFDFLTIRACIALAVLTSALSEAAPPLPAGGALANGFEPAHVEQLHAFMRSAIGSGEYLGAVTLVARNGAIVDWRAYGHRDLAKRSPMQRDAIFRILSMTKTIATVAVLMLMEDGKLALDDPLGRHLPEFAASPITIRHLLTHTSGLPAAGEAIEVSADLKAFSVAAARMTPTAPPGKRFVYNSVNSELASRVVEVASGLAFDAFLRQRIFVPLGMNDTGFTVPIRKQSRIAELTSTDGNGRLVAWLTENRATPGARLRPYPSGAGGLYSTAGDFARFCQMLLNGGRLEGVALLSRETVAMMMTNQLTALVPPVSQYNEGFGFGGYVNLDSPGRERPGSVGAFGWSGAAATYFIVDPHERLFAILLLQHVPQGLARDPRKISFAFYNHVYRSLREAR